MIMFVRLSDQLGRSILDGLKSGDVAVEKDDLQTVQICCLRVRALSKTIPRLHADGVGSMLASPILISARVGVLRNFEWIGRNLVLSPFRFDKSRGIQC